MPFAATWMDLEINMLSEVTKTDVVISLICGLKNDTDELIYKTETDLQISKTNLGLLKGKHGGMHTSPPWV